MALISKITAVADAIRAKTGDTETMTLAEMPDKIAAIESASAYENYIYSDFEMHLRYPDVGALEREPSLDYYDDETTEILDRWFYTCAYLRSVDFPACTSIGFYAFSYCTALATADFPACTSIGTYAFYNCTALTTADFPLCTTIWTYAFYYCTGLTAADFPVCAYIKSFAFSYCTALATADFPVCTSIATYAFYGCTALTALILRSETVCTLSATSAFTSSAIASGTGYIYVPSDLVESYQEATNWSTYADQFRAIEDYPDICG